MSSQPSPGSPVPEIPECTVERGPDGRLYLTHESGRTATALDERGAKLVGMALCLLAEYGGPQPPGMRPVHLEWRHDDLTLRTGELP